MYRDISVKTSKEKNSFKMISIMILLAFILVFLTISTKGSKPIVYKNITIKEGDTLWSIVREYNDKEMDPRKMISEIKKINNLKDVVLRPGQTIKVPEF
ncbi:MAG: LysM peptidoglycan-binding domain-containing protein [Halanaerobiaceae bacterium]|nr:LysM peptidoglycan-binding domain-containing protein [Halanaerobiaceae bacterium]